MFSTSIIAKSIKHIRNTLYVYPGGTIAPLLHESKREGLEIIVAKNEQGAGYMALAEALSSHKPSFVAVTSGPGITNLITVIADAYYDSIPLIIFSGQVGTGDLDRGNELRQRGFQEVPIVDMVQKITKKCFQPRSIDEIADAISEAIWLSTYGRKGPVLIDLPMNIQLQELTNPVESYIKTLLCSNYHHQISQESILHCASLLNHAKKPLILLGGGAQESWKKIRHFLEICPIPTLSSLRGIGIVASHLSQGWIGHTGLPWANTLLYEADTILVLGSRLDIRQTGSQLSTFSQKTVIHVDIDEYELTLCRIPNTLKFQISIEDFLEAITSHLAISDNTKWHTQIAHIKSSYALQDWGKLHGVNPNELLSYINTLLGQTPCDITTGVGSHQHWVPRYIEFDNAYRRFFTSAGHGTMGFGLPVAIGLQLQDPNKRIICIDGDGSFQMNIQELAVIQERQLSLKILVLDNSRLGIVSQFQQITFKDDPTTGDIINPDFCKIALAYGIEAYSLESMNHETIHQWLHTKKAALLHVKIKHDTPLSPMLLGGQELNAMWYAHV